MNNTNIIHNKRWTGYQVFRKGVALPAPLVTLVTFLVNVRWLHFNSKSRDTGNIG
jgi:hypothetical protein